MAQVGNVILARFNQYWPVWPAKVFCVCRKNKILSKFYNEISPQAFTEINADEITPFTKIAALSLRFEALRNKSTVLKKAIEMAIGEHEEP